MIRCEQRIVILAAACAVAWTGGLTARAEGLPDLAPGIALDSGSSRILDSQILPEVVDWDNDGRKDLLLGVRGQYHSATGGVIVLYRNVGTDENPAFDGFEVIQSGGSTLVTSYS